MKNKKRNLIITIVLLVIIFVIGGVVFFLNYSSDDNSLTLLEKKWVTDNSNKIVDVDIYNNMPIYSYNGEGIVFDYLNYFTKKYEIKFNKISYFTEKLEKDSNMAFLLLNNNEKLTNRDILIYEDHYVLLSLDNNLSVDNIETVGVLKTDSDIIKAYFGDKVKYVEYDKIGDLISGLNNKTISYVALPNINYMDIILKNKLNIVKHISDLKRKFVLRVKDNTTYNVMNKTYQDYLNNSYSDDYSNNYLNIYFKSTNTSDLLSKNFNSKRYNYGYVINMPYENNVNNEFVGTISNYLDSFERSTQAEINIQKYNSIDELKSALINGDIDFALANFSYENINMENIVTSSIIDYDYVVISKNDYSVNSIKGFIHDKISVVTSSNLYQLCKDNNIETNNYDNTDDLLKSLDDNSIAIIDKETYIYYKNDKLKDYKVIIDGSLDGYKFILNKKNEPFDSMFSYFVTTIDYQGIRYLYNTDVTIDKDYTTLKVIIFIGALILFLVTTVMLVNKKNVTSAVINKDDKLKYLDPMTSLKNRSYLNLNIYKWDENVIYPQSVIVIDINKIKEINDKLGREAGDEIIRKVASILINSQLENTDIIRSGGDEFLIYMVGYSENEVIDYTKKLTNDMRNIPNSSGVKIGYSMIMDEVKSVDDAINEAINMMSKEKSL